jgi:hypothetical protein
MCNVWVGAYVAEVGASFAAAAGGIVKTAIKWAPKIIFLNEEIFFALRILNYQYTMKTKSVNNCDFLR